jgi:hypothetical protein
MAIPPWYTDLDRRLHALLLEGAWASRHEMVRSEAELLSDEAVAKLQAKLARQTTEGGRKGVLELLAYLEACRRDGVDAVSNDPAYRDPETQEFARGMAINRVLHAKTWDERRRILAESPWLVEPAFVKSIAEAGESATEPRIRGAAYLITRILARVREVGVDRACAEFEAEEERSSAAKGLAAEDSGDSGEPKDEFARAYETLCASAHASPVDGVVYMSPEKLREAAQQFHALAEKLRARKLSPTSPFEEWEIFGRALFFTGVTFTAATVEEEAEKAYRATCRELRPRGDDDARANPRVASYRLLAAIALDAQSRLSDEPRADLESYAREVLTGIEGRGFGPVVEICDLAFWHIVKVDETKHTDVGHILAVQLLSQLLVWESRSGFEELPLRIDFWWGSCITRHMEAGRQRSAVGGLEGRLRHALQHLKRDIRCVRGAIESATLLSVALREHDRAGAAQIASLAKDLIRQLRPQAPPDSEYGRMCTTALQHLANNGLG